MTAVLTRPDVSEQSQRRPLSKQPAFRRLWFGEGVSVFGTATSTILIPLLAVIDLHASAWAMGLLTAAAWVPWLLIGLPAGAIVDQLPSRAVMITADLVSAVALASIPLVWAMHALTIAQLLSVAAVTGTCTVFFRAAYPGLVKDIVAEDQLTDANARMYGTESAAQLAGPGIGGWLAGVVGAAAGVLIDVGSFLVSAVCLWRLPLRSRRRVATDQPPLRSRIAAGLRFVYTDRLLRFFTIMGGVSNFGLTGFQAIMVLFLVRTAGVSPFGVGMLLMIDGLGAVLGAAAAARLARRVGEVRAMMLLAMIAGPPSIAFGLIGHGAGIAPAVLALPALGFGVVGGNVLRGAFRMRYVPAEMQGRAVTATQLVNFGTMPLAALVAGSLGGVLGLRTTILLMLGIHIVATLAVLRMPVRGRDLPRSYEC